MQSLHARALLHGLVGGLIAGAVVAIWFLIVDLATGLPLQTPTALAAAVLGHDLAIGTVRLVTTYTILHFGVFALLGMATSWAIAVFGATPGLVLGAVFGIGVLDSVYYGGLLMTGADMLTVLPPEHVLAANLMGGMAMMAYLHQALHTQSKLGFAVIRDHGLLVAGLVTGLIGAFAVAVWFLILDALTGEPFFTPAALGSLVLLGATSPLDVEVSLGVVAAYTIFHLAAFTLVGVALVWVAERLQRTPSLWLLGVLAFIVLEGLFIGTLGALGEWVLGLVSWWAIGIGNLVAVLAMGAWVWWSHPTLRQHLLAESVNTLL